MGKKLTPQQEHFCREYVRTGVGAQAYRLAYKVKPDIKPETVWQEASRLLANPMVAARIRATQDSLTDVTLGEIVAGYRQARDIAIEDRQPAAATGAISGLARVKGFLKDDPAKAGDIHIHFDAALAEVL